MRNSQHKRSLVTGLVLAAVTPVIIAIFLVLISDTSTNYSLDIAFYGLIAGLMVSIPSTFFGALPLFIFLQRKSILNGIFLCLGCSIIGVVAMAITEYIIFIEFDSDFTSQSFKLNVPLLFIGAGLGFVAGFGLTCGSGTPFLQPFRNSETKT